MGLQLPGELRSLLSMLGYSWPEADETKLMEMGGAWLRFAGTLGGQPPPPPARPLTTRPGLRIRDRSAAESSDA